MVARNEITGKELRSGLVGEQYLENFKAVDSSITLANTPQPEFKVYECANCHIKVSTSNGKCPCCNGKLKT